MSFQNKQTSKQTIATPIALPLPRKEADARPDITDSSSKNIPTAA